MIKIYNNMVVEINDPDERLTFDEELTVQFRYCKENGKMYITIPEEKKPTPKAEKPQPENVYTGVLTNIKGTIATNGNALVSMNIKPEKAKALGRTTVKAELIEAFGKVYDRITAPPTPEGE